MDTPPFFGIEKGQPDIFDYPLVDYQFFPNRFGLFYVFRVDFYVFEGYLLRTSVRYHPASVIFILNFFEE